MSLPPGITLDEEGGLPPGITLDSDEDTALGLSHRDPNRPGVGEALLRGGSQGVLLNHRDEIVGALESLLDKVRGKPGDLGENYDKHRDESRAADEKAQKAHKLAYGASSLAGGLATLAIPGVGEGGMLAQAGQLAALGAISGAGNAKTLDEIPAEAGKEALGGALAGAGGVLAGRALGAIGRRAAPSLQNVADAATNRAMGQTGATLKGVSQADRHAMAETGREFLSPLDTVGHVSEKLEAARDATNDAIGSALREADDVAFAGPGTVVEMPGAAARPGSRTFVAEPPPRSPVNGEPVFAERVVNGRPVKVQTGGARAGQVDATDYAALGYEAPRVVETPGTPAIPPRTEYTPSSPTTSHDVADVLKGVLEKHGGNVTVSDAAGNYLEGVVRKLEARGGAMSLQELDVIRRDLGKMVKWNVAEQMAPGSNTIAADAYGAIRQHIQNRLSEISGNPGVGEVYDMAMKRSSTLTGLTDQAQARAGQLEGQQPFGLSGRVGLVAGVGAMAAGSPIAGLALIAAGFAQKGLEQRGNALAGVALNKLAKAAADPAKMALLGKWGGYVASAAQRGPTALAAAHYTAAQMDGQYAANARTLMNEPEQSGESGVDDVLNHAPSLKTSIPVREP